MRILYVSDRRNGGIRSHVQCLLKSLPPGIGRYAIGEDEPFAGRNGHDPREWAQIRRVVRDFRPDIVHFHTAPFLMALYVRLFTRLPRVVSLHTPQRSAGGAKDRLLDGLLSPCYYLPVSGVTWADFRRRRPDARGEVFFNPLPLNELPEKAKGGGPPVVGMVGRNAGQKDWPSFHRVEALVKARRPEVEFWNLGEKGNCPNAREMIGRMDLFLMTSRHEQLPTTLLEAFGMRTAVCGFIPAGGVSDILAFSKGPVRSAFIAERDCNELARKVIDLLDDAKMRESIVSDGFQILEEHFEALKNCATKLVPIYRKVASHGC